MAAPSYYDRFFPRVLIANGKVQVSLEDVSF